MLTKLVPKRLNLLSFPMHHPETTSMLLTWTQISQSVKCIADSNFMYEGNISKVQI